MRTSPYFLLFVTSLLALGITSQASWSHGRESFDLNNNKGSTNYTYCNPADLIDDGLFPKSLYDPSSDKEMELEFVILITRHGDRTPTVSIPEVGLDLDQSEYVKWECTENGFSFPIDGLNKTLPQIPRGYRLEFLEGRNLLGGNCMTGQLTSVGANQHLKLGGLLRDRYVDKLKFLSKDINPEEMWVRSTNVYRTIQSAQNLLLGFYPVDDSSSKCQDIPIIDFFSIDNAEDNMTPNTALCPRIVELVAELEKSSDYKKHLKDIAKVSDEVRDLLNVTTDTIPWIGLFDINNARTCHNFPLLGDISDDLQQAINDEGVYEMNFFYLELPYPEKRDVMAAANLTTIRKLGMGSFVQEMVGQINAAVAGNQSHKLVYYSGHDTTLGPLLQTLQMGPGYWPPYASHLVTELWKNKTTGDFYISSSYNGEQVKPQTCGKSDDPMLCRLEDYLQNAYNSMPSDFEKECACVSADCGLGHDAVKKLQLRSKKSTKELYKWRYY